MAEMGYVWRIPGCGCIVAAQVDGLDYAREIEKFKNNPTMAEGFVLDYIPADQVRSEPWGWPCEHMTATSAASTQSRQATPDPDSGAVR